MTGMVVRLRGGGRGGLEVAAAAVATGALKRGGGATLGGSGGVGKPGSVEGGRRGGR
eukprot:evm.model.NODE_37165_length_1034_cov_16.623791.1